MFYYYLNNIDLKEPYWTNSSTRMLDYEEFVKNGLSPQKTKFLRGYLINNGGWHFSYLGGVDKISKKIQSFSHILNPDTVKKYSIINNIKEKIKNGEDLYSSKNEKRLAGIEIDKSFPIYIINNANLKYKHLICNINLNFHDKLILLKNKIRISIISYIKNKFLTKHINIANYENI